MAKIIKLEELKWKKARKWKCHLLERWDECEMEIKKEGVVLERVREWEEGRWCCGGTMAQLNSVRKMILDALNDGCKLSEYY